MHTRLNQNDVTNRVNVEDAGQVRDAVIAMYAARYPGADLVAARARLRRRQGRCSKASYPGYLRCDTLYHDARHTLDMTLAMARLVEGHDRVAPRRRARWARAAPCSAW